MSIITEAHIRIEQFEDLVSRHGEYEGVAYPMITLVHCNDKVLGWVLEKLGSGTYIASFPDDSMFSPIETSTYGTAMNHLAMAAVMFAGYTKN